MSSFLAVLALAVGTITVFAFVVTFPRQIIRPILRDKLLRLLDDIDWARRDGVVPADNHAVMFLRQTIIFAVVDRRLTMVDLTYTAPRAAALMPPAHVPSPWKLTTQERAHYDELRRRFSLLVPAYVFFGSWSGITYATTKVFGVMFSQARTLVVRWVKGTANAPEPFPDEIVDYAVTAIQQHHQFALAA